MDMTNTTPLSGDAFFEEDAGLPYPAAISVGDKRILLNDSELDALYDVLKSRRERQGWAYQDSYRKWLEKQ
jgi:hypothetical protein